jgi:hypothetical protein
MNRGHSNWCCIYDTFSTFQVCLFIIKFASNLAAVKYKATSIRKIYVFAAFQERKVRGLFYLIFFRNNRKIYFVN